MGTRWLRTATVLVVSVAISIATAWFDRWILTADLQRATDNYEMDPIALSMPVGYLLAVAGVLAMAALSRWEPSPLVGVLYAIGGAALAFALPLTVLTPERWSARGPAHLLSAVGAGMLLVGIATLVRAARHRPGPAGTEASTPLDAGGLAVSGSASRLAAEDHVTAFASLSGGDHSADTSHLTSP